MGLILTDRQDIFALQAQYLSGSSTTSFPAYSGCTPSGYSLKLTVSVHLVDILKAL